MVTPRLTDLTLYERFPKPPIGTINIEPDRIYLPPIKKNHQHYYLIAGVIITLLTTYGIYCLIYKQKPIATSNPTPINQQQTT